MAAPNNPFGAPASQQASNPFAAQSPFSTASPFAKPATPFGRSPSPSIQLGPGTTTPSGAGSAPLGVNGFPQQSSNTLGVPAPFGTTPTISTSPFGGAPAATSTTSFFSTASKPTNAFGPSANAATPFGGSPAPAAGLFGTTPASSTGVFGAPATATNPLGTTNTFGSPATGAGAFGASSTLQPGENLPSVNSSTTERAQKGGKTSLRSERNDTSRGEGPTEGTRGKSDFSHNYANKLLAHLQREKIKPPQWPSAPGNPKQHGAMETLKDGFKKYRARAYASLRKADLIDDPDKRRRLEDALDFKGICEDMCPEFEKIFRIAEYDVTSEEKRPRSDGGLPWADPSLMVKKFARSAAGQDAPLPMDVRSVDALRRTTDYLFDDLLQDESRLPSLHNYLWDRSRAVRKDFTFHSYKTAEEMKSLVYCFENIARFHATALHLLSRKGFAEDGFDQKQEIEQLGRTILSLMEAYDACRDKKIECENEPEFRAYYLLLNAHEPSIIQRIPTWGKAYWFDSEEVQTALCLINAMEDVRERKGPIKPRRVPSLKNTMFVNFFAIVEQPSVSYTMACIAAIHFTYVRQCALKNLVKGYARHRDAPRTITADVLNGFLRFDDPDDAVEFAKLHDFEFSTENPKNPSIPETPYLLLNNRNQRVPSPRVPQSFSGQLVERKRNGQSLPHVIHNTIFEQSAGGQKKETSISPDGLFVKQSNAAQTAPSNANGAISSPFSGSETSAFGGGAVKPSFPTAQSSSQGSSQIMTSPSNTQGFSIKGQASTPAPGSAFPTAPQAGTGFPKPNPFSSFPPPAPEKAPAASLAPNPFGSFPPAANGPSGAPPKPSIFGGAPQPSTGPSPGGDPKPGLFSFLGAAGPEGTKPPSGLPGTSGPVPSSIFTSSNAEAGTASSAKEAPAVSPSTITEAHIPQAAPSNEKLPSSSILDPSASTSTAWPLGTKTPTLSGIPSATPVPEALNPPAAATPSFFTLGQTQQPAAISFAKPSTDSSLQLPEAFAPLIGKEAQAELPAQLVPPTINPSLPNSLGQSGSGLLGRLPATLGRRDLMGDFAKWFTLGDGGLIEQFVDVTLEAMVATAFAEYEKAEEERKSREEDERSWQEAREFQVYNLRVKYFYRWREIAKNRRMKSILREGKRKQREYYANREHHMKEQAERAQRQAADEKRRATKRARDDVDAIATMARSQRLSSSVARASAVEQAEQDLLASGIFSGTRDERAMAQRVVAEASEADYPYPVSEFKTPARPRELSMSAGSGSAMANAKVGSKTQALLERFDLSRSRSVSAASSVNGSRNASARPNNFSASRKRSAGTANNTDGRSPKRMSVFSSTHWDLRARGFVPTTSGGWQPEALAHMATVTSSRTSLSPSPHPFPFPSRSPTPPSFPRNSDAGANDADRMPPPSRRRISTEIGHEITKEEADASIANTRRMLEELRATMDGYEPKVALAGDLRGNVRN